MMLSFAAAVLGLLPGVLGGGTLLAEIWVLTVSGLQCSFLPETPASHFSDLTKEGVCIASPVSRPTHTKLGWWLPWRASDA